VPVLALIGVLVTAHAVAPAADVDDDGVVDEAVDDGGGDDLVGKDLAPIREAAVGSEHDGRGLLVATADDLEDPVGRGLVERQVADLVDDQDRGLEVGAQLVESAAGEVGGLQVETMSAAEVK
jgi:hypothetical protein